MFFDHGLSILTNLQENRFAGGLVHKVSKALGVPVSISVAANLVNGVTPGKIFHNDALRNISALDLLYDTEATKDFTIFTVDNPVWDKLIDQKVTLPSLESLPEYLEYYVMVGKVLFLGDFKGQNVKTLNGDAVNLLGAEKAEYEVNYAKLVRGGIFVSNRVIHVLDR